jgi:hypothetical protein
MVVVGRVRTGSVCVGRGIVNFGVRTIAAATVGSVRRQPPGGEEGRGAGGPQG